MTEDETVSRISGLPGVVAMKAGAENGAPEVAWGDWFFYYDPDDAGPESRRFPFATVVVKDYPGFDTDSQLDRPGVFRLNLPVGRERFTELFGFAPAEFDDHRAEFDFTALDAVLPHPAYGSAAWISVLVPGAGTQPQVGEFLRQAHTKAKRNYPS